MGRISNLVVVADLDWPQGSFKAGEEEQVQPKRQRQRQQAAPAPALRCPRCDSGNTKFCYYNNYSRSQPRHFCKACRRHWTEGGTLRNVPVGGVRKGKRPKLSYHHPADGITTAVSSSIQQQQQQQEEEQLQLFPAPVLPPSGFLDSSSGSGIVMGSLLPFQLLPPATTMIGGELCASFFPEQEEMTTMEGSLAPVAAPSHMWLPLPGVGGASSSSSSSLDTSSYWSCWDELAGLDSLDLTNLNKV